MKSFGIGNLTSPTPSSCCPSLPPLILLTRQVPLGFWNSDVSGFSFLSWLGLRLGLARFSDWPKRTHAELGSHRGAQGFLNRFQHSTIAALKHIYPQYQWREARFEVALPVFPSLSHLMLHPRIVPRASGMIQPKFAPWSIASACLKEFGGQQTLSASCWPILRSTLAPLTLTPPVLWRSWSDEGPRPLPLGSPPLRLS